VVAPYVVAEFWSSQNKWLRSTMGTWSASELEFGPFSLGCDSLTTCDKRLREGSDPSLGLRPLFHMP
jgi:hypothetical protein